MARVRAHMRERSGTEMHRSAGFAHQEPRTCHPLASDTRQYHETCAASMDFAGREGVSSLMCWTRKKPTRAPPYSLPINHSCPRLDRSAARAFFWGPADTGYAPTAGLRPGLHHRRAAPVHGDGPIALARRKRADHTPTRWPVPQPTPGRPAGGKYGVPLPIPQPSIHP